ncbi:hypothetical protein RRG08_017164 [Elysia crispata]|uniref:Uncharacterized protein n=1 Tax=Elysia crispata TaxID=231223 RepID=A0AAE1B1S3_9GAST|nr:hypothetical protein RRG08_017164 [Elysia crispata]
MEVEHSKFHSRLQEESLDSRSSTLCAASELTVYSCRLVLHFTECLPTNLTRINHSTREPRRMITVTMFRTEHPPQFRLLCARLPGRPPRPRGAESKELERFSRYITLSTGLFEP